MLKLFIVMAIGYLFGSVNLSIIVTKYIGRFDIRKKGSGNAGGTNVARTMGASWGIAVMVFEILKGVIVGLLARYVWPVDPLSLGVLGPQITGAIAIIGVMIGNMYPCFHGLKGGKGVTTCGALMLVVDYRLFFVLFAIFVIVFLITHIVSVSSIIGSIGVPVSLAVVYHGQPYWWLLCAVAGVNTVMLIIRHRSNIKRLLHGTENKFTFGEK